MKSDPNLVETIDPANLEESDDEALTASQSHLVVALHKLAAIREDELPTVSWACLFHFGLLAGNYLIHPVRDEMGIAGGTQNLPTLFTGTLLVIVGLGALFSGRFGIPRIRLNIVPIVRAYQLCLIGFFVAVQAMPAWGQPWTARAFFIVASVANLLVVSVAWGALARRFTTDQAHRLFGLVAAGGTVGAIAGSAIAGVLAAHAGPAPLLIVAIGFLELTPIAARRVFSDGDPDSISVRSQYENSAPEEPARCSSRLYLLGLGFWTLLFTISSAFVYLEQARIVQSAIGDSAVRTSFFARIDLLVNVLGLSLQVLLTGRALAYLGAGGAAAMLPLVTLAGAILLALRPSVVTVQWFQVARRAVDYAIARPSREVLYTAVRRAQFLGAKGFIDTAVYRAGDAAGAWVYGLFASIPAMSFRPPVALVPLSLLWIVLSLVLGRVLNSRRERG